MRTLEFDNSARTAELRETDAVGESEGRRSVTRRRNPCPSAKSDTICAPQPLSHVPFGNWCDSGAALMGEHFRDRSTHS